MFCLFFSGIKLASAKFDKTLEMVSNKRQHIRLILDIPVFRFTRRNERISTMIYQVSIGGCLLEWDDAIGIDEEFRLEIKLPNENFLPVHCRVIYLFENDSIGIKFQDITKFEQELIAEVMKSNLTEEGIPVRIDPFSKHTEFMDYQEPTPTAV